MGDKGSNGGKDDDIGANVRNAGASTAVVEGGRVFRCVLKDVDVCGWASIGAMLFQLVGVQINWPYFTYSQSGRNTNSLSNISLWGIVRSGVSMTIWS